MKSTKKVYTDPEIINLYTACFGKDGCDDDEFGG